jgi:GTP-binding protein EngB required for normal cell division
MFLNILDLTMSSEPMPLDKYHSNPPTIAVMFIGNIGAGKSTLLSQIGGRFAAGVKFRQGFTKGISECPVILQSGDNPPMAAVLMDIPGLFEPNEQETKGNCEVLTRALKKDYSFKLVFVLKADNRGATDQDLVLMSRVNSCVREAGAMDKVEFQVIVNQIMDEQVYNMYERHVAHDNFRALFATLEIKGFSFDIRIQQVHLFMFNKDKIDKGGFASDILKLLFRQTHIRVSLLEDISVTNEELTFFEVTRAHAGSFLAGVATTVGFFAYFFALFQESRPL